MKVVVNILQQFGIQLELYMRNQFRQRWWVALTSSFISCALSLAAGVLWMRARSLMTAVLAWGVGPLRSMVSMFIKPSGPDGKDCSSDDVITPFCAVRGSVAVAQVKKD